MLESQINEEILLFLLVNQDSYPWDFVRNLGINFTAVL